MFCESQKKNALLVFADLEDEEEIDEHQPFPSLSQVEATLIRE